MAEKKTSFKIDEDTWTNFRIACLKIKKDASEVLEELVNGFLKK